mmetsp:Transcript_60491/g.142750  ORF Transcript_60491/g.142750 Transcript_60491/m.142750 type:complete len:206 (+) Transcript_60491:527-1144(+)
MRDTCHPSMPPTSAAPRTCPWAMLGQCRTSILARRGMNSISASTPSSVMPRRPARQMLSSLNASPRRAAHCAMKNMLMSVTERTPRRRERGHAPMSRCLSSAQQRVAHITPSSLTRQPRRLRSSSEYTHWLRHRIAIRVSSTLGHQRRSRTRRLGNPQHISSAIGSVRACSSVFRCNVSIPFTSEAPDAHRAVQLTFAHPRKSAS